MKKRLKELSEIAKTGSKEDVIAYLSNLEVPYFSERYVDLEATVISCKEEIENYLDRNSEQKWQDDLQDDLIYLIEVISCYEDNGLLYQDDEGYRYWRDFSIDSKYFIEDIKELKVTATVDLDSYLQKIKTGKLIVTKSNFREEYYIFKEDDKLSWNKRPHNSLRISDKWNFIYGIELNEKVSDYYQPINQLMIGVFNGSAYDIAEINETKIKVFLEEIKNQKEGN